MSQNQNWFTAEIILQKLQAVKKQPSLNPQEIPNVGSKFILFSYNTYKRDRAVTSKAQRLGPTWVQGGYDDHHSCDQWD